MLSKMMVVGTIMNGALFLTGVTVIGYLLGNPIAWKCGLAALGVAYLNYYLNANLEIAVERGLAVNEVWRSASMVLWGISVLLAVVAGLKLLFA